MHVFSVLQATESWAEPGNEGRRMQLNSLATFPEIIPITGNLFDWLEYSVNLSDNSRAYIVVATYPGHVSEGKVAWYSLFAHARKTP